MAIEDWTESNKSPVENYGVKGFTVTRTFYGPFDDRETFLDAITENADYPGNPRASISSIKFKTHGDACSVDRAGDPVPDLNTFQSPSGNDKTCVATVEYTTDFEEQLFGASGAGTTSNTNRTRKYKQKKPKERSDEVYQTVKSTGRLNLQTLKSINSYAWKDFPNDKVPVDSVLRIPEVVFTVTEHMASEPNWSDLAKFVGSVNSKTIKIPLVTKSFRPATLLFEDYDVEVERKYSRASKSIEEFWKTDMNFVYKELIDVPIGIENDEIKLSQSSDTIGWDYFFNEDKGYWMVLQQRVWDDSNKEFVYKDGIFPKLNYGKLLT